MAKLFNRAKMTTSTTGTGTITLGSAASGFQSFADAGVVNGDVVQYVIEEGSDFEIGTGTYTSSGTTLTRTPTESSNSDAAITLAGQATVSITAVAADMNRLQHNGSDKVTVSSTGASVTGNISVTGTVDGRDVATDGSKLDGIESGATADQTAAEIRSLVESASDSNVFTDADHTKLNGIEAGATADQTITAGSGLTGGGTGDVTISHSDTSTQSSVNNSGRTYIQDITLDGFGHVTGIASATETVTAPTVNNATITISAGTDLTTGGDFTTNQGTNETITINHADTSTLSGTYGSTANGTKIDQITVDARGHVTGITTGSTGSMDSFQLEDGDGTEVTVNNGKEVKFVEGGGIDINWTDTSTGSDGDPYDMTFTINTGVTAGNGLTGGGTLNATRTLNVGAGGGITVSADAVAHADTSSQASVNNSNGTVIQDVTLDTYGHVTGLTSYNLDGRYYTETESDSRYARKDTSTRQDFTGSIRVSTNNTTGGGIVLADDGDIVDLNDGYASMRFSAGVRVYSSNGGGSVRHTLHSNGSFTATGNITAYSDERLKENIVIIENALDKVNAIRGVTYNRNDIEETNRHAGVIAQEVEKVLPEVVATDDQGIKHVAYGNMVGLLIEAIKEQQVQINELKAKLEV